MCAYILLIFSTPQIILCFLSVSYFTGHRGDVKRNSNVTVVQHLKMDEGQAYEEPTKDDAPKEEVITIKI